MSKPRGTATTVEQSGNPLLLAGRAGDDLMLVENLRQRLRNIPLCGPTGNLDKQIMVVNAATLLESRPERPNARGADLNAL